MIERQQLQEIQDKAWSMYAVTPENEWKWAFLSLAQAADHLDAMMARNNAGACGLNYTGPVSKIEDAGGVVQTHGEVAS